MRELPPWAEALLVALVAGLGAGAFVAAERQVGTGFPLDDAYIHLQMARNLSTGGGFGLNAGEPVAASTAPLWTLLVAALHFAPGDIFALVKAAGALLLFAAALLSGALARALGLARPWALLAALVVALTPRLLWAAPSGMEVLLYAALSTGGILLHVRHFGRAPSPAASALFAAAALARPECLVLFPLAVLDRWRLEGSPARTLALYGRHIVLYTALLLPFALFNWRYGSGVLPNTFYAKAGPYGLLGALAHGEWLRAAAALTLYPLEQAVEVARFAAENNLALALLAPLGALALLRRGREASWLLVLVPVVFPLARGALAPFKGATFQHGRYAASLIPLLTVLGLLGAQLAWQVLRRGWAHPQVARGRRWGGRLLAVLVLGIGLVGSVQYGREYAANVGDINRVHVAMGAWLRDHVPPAALIATNDIGAISYYSRRRILDIVGLASPRTLQYLRPGVPADRGVLRLLMAARPDYLVILPNWYPQLARMGHLFQPVHEVGVEGSTIVGGSRLVAYRTVWAR